MSDQCGMRSAECGIKDRIAFTKMAGAGNDFVVLDARRGPLAAGAPWSLISRGLCDRRRSIGADGLLVLAPSKAADVRMRIFNPDGSEPSMCGNGVRCLALFASRHGVRRKAMTIETLAGIKRARIGGNNRVTVDLGPPAFLRHLAGLRLGGWSASHADVIDAGVPHLVCWVREVTAVDVDGMGRRLRHHRRFRPAGVNVDFVQLVRAGRARDARGEPVHRLAITMRTYERGVEGETRACGTGAVASAASAAHAVLAGGEPLTHAPKVLVRGLATPSVRFQVEVRAPGGVLHVELAAKPGRGGRPAFGPAYLEGEVKQMARGYVALNGGVS